MRDPVVGAELFGVDCVGARRVPVEFGSDGAVRGDGAGREGASDGATDRGGADGASRRVPVEGSECDGADRGSDRGGGAGAGSDRGGGADGVVLTVDLGWASRVKPDSMTIRPARNHAAEKAVRRIAVPPITVLNGCL